MGTMYPVVCKIQKLITYNQAKGAFGFVQTYNLKMCYEMNVVHKLCMQNNIFFFFATHLGRHRLHWKECVPSHSSCTVFCSGVPVHLRVQSQSYYTYFQIIQNRSQVVERFFCFSILSEKNTTSTALFHVPLIKIPTSA